MLKLPNEDLFQDTTMTFGEHLDELRRCLMKAVIGLVIGIFQQKNDSLALKALLTVLGAYAVSIFLPRLTGDPLHIPDFRRLSAIVQVVMMYVFAYGVVGVVGTTKTAMKFQAKKA